MIYSGLGIAFRGHLPFDARSHPFACPNRQNGPHGVKIENFQKPRKFAFINVKFYDMKWSRNCDSVPFALFDAHSHPFACPNQQNGPHGRTSGNFGKPKKFAFINVKSLLHYASVTSLFGQVWPNGPIQRNVGSVQVPGSRTDGRTGPVRLRMQKIWINRKNHYYFSL